MRTASNKVILSKEKERKLRKLFFQKKETSLICSEIGISTRVLYRIVNEKNWFKKRERYYLFLIKKAYRNEISIEQICKDAGIRNAEILRRVKRKYGVKTCRFDIANKKMTTAMEKNIIEDYKKEKSSVYLAKKYNFKTSKSILDVLRKYDIKRRPASKITYFNRDYFKKINSHDKAYILGFLLTDGYVIRDHKGIAIQITESDGYILERMAKRLGKSTTITSIDCSKKREKYPNTRDMKRMSCYCPEFALDLKDRGMTKNKTHDLRCPTDILKKYMSSFFRGLWDGDGTISRVKKTTCRTSLGSASEKFIDDLQYFLCEFNFKSSKHKLKNKYFWSIDIMGGHNSVVKFLKWIYKDKGNLYLERKYAKVQDKIN